MKNFGSLCEHIFCTGLKWKIQFWNFGLLCDHYGSLCEIWHRFQILDHYVIIMKWKIHYLAQVSWTSWYIDIGLESPIFLLLKKLFFFNISNRLNQLNRTTKNRTAIVRKTDPRQCASVPIMKKPISISLVINLEKNLHYRTTHTPNYNSPFSCISTSYILVNIIRAFWT